MSIRSVLSFRYGVDEPHQGGPFYGDRDEYRCMRTSHLAEAVGF